MSSSDCKYETATLNYFCCQLNDNDVADIEIHVSQCDECCETLAKLAKLRFKEESEEEEAFLDGYLVDCKNDIRELVKKSLEFSDIKNSQQELVNKYLLKEDIVVSKPRFWVSIWRTKTLIAASLVILFSLIIVALLSLSNNAKTSTKVSQSIVILNQINLSGRPTTFRISNFDYSLPIKSRSNEKEIQERLATLIDGLSNTVKNNPSAISRQVLAQALIMKGDYDKATEELTIAMELSPKDVSIMNDLVVAQAAKENYHQALIVANKVLTINPKYLPALFNRALIYQQVEQYNNAYSDWNNYLQLDATSAWAIEGQKYLSAIK